MDSAEVFHPAPDLGTSLKRRRAKQSRLAFSRRMGSGLLDAFHRRFEATPFSMRHHRAARRRLRQRAARVELAAALRALDHLPLLPPPEADAPAVGPALRGRALHFARGVRGALVSLKTFRVLDCILVGFNAFHGVLILFTQ